MLRTETENFNAQFFFFFFFFVFFFYISQIHNDQSNGEEEQYEPPTGQTLGVLSNELASGEFIWRFQALAPKNYRFEVRHESDPLGATVRSEMRCKGQLLTANVKNSFDWEIYEALIDQKIKPLAQSVL